MTYSRKLIYLTFDFFALNIALVLTYKWFWGDLSFFISQEFKIITIVINLLWFSTLIYSKRIYTQLDITSTLDDIKNLIPNFLIHTLLSYVLVITLLHKIGFSFSIYCGILLFLLLSGRVIIKSIISKITLYKTLNYITIGYCDALPKIGTTLKDQHLGKVNYLGAFESRSQAHFKHLGNEKDIMAYLEQNKVNLILYVSNTLPPSVLRELMHYAKHNYIEFKIIPTEMDMLADNMRLELHNGLFLSAKDEFVFRFRNIVLKRAFDILFSLCVIVFILSWLFPLLCLLIVLETKGSPIFLQDRLGLRGKRFRCIKFRSLKVQENGADVKQVQREDTRITKVGAFIRKTNLDEMPQFFNVLIGDMSIVGPRPHPISLDKEFIENSEAYSLRYYTRPGITGWAQVNGWRGPTDTFDKMNNRTQCDLWYIKHRCLRLDIKIVFLTVFGSKVWQNAF
jgi:exopolysaccharide biosynthesis polyprenyl glycosylphosphotransferase